MIIHHQTSQGFDPVKPSRMVHGMLDRIKGLSKIGSKVKSVKKDTSVLGWLWKISSAPVWVPIWAGYKTIQGASILSRDLADTIREHAPGGAAKTVETVRNLVSATFRDAYEVSLSPVEEQAKAVLNYANRMTLQNTRIMTKSTLNPPVELLKGAARTTWEVLKSPVNLINGTRQAMHQVFKATPHALFKEKSLGLAAKELLMAPVKFVDFNTRPLQEVVKTPVNIAKNAIINGAELFENNLNAHTGPIRGLVNGVRRQIRALGAIEDHLGNFMDTITFNKSFNAPVGAVA